MSKRKGLSLEEKRKRMLEIFYEKKDVFQLKELEKIGPQEKGIISQSVKDVVQSLVDDGYVDSEKIGTSVYFWAFPSKAAVTRKRKLATLESKMVDITEKTKVVENKVKEAKLSRDDTSERVEIMEQITKLKTKKENLKKKLEQFEESDPDVLAEDKKEVEIAVVAVNRWTDNIFNMKSWIKSKCQWEEEKINNVFGIPEDLDYIE